MAEVSVSNFARAAALALAVTGASAAVAQSDPVQSYDSYQSWLVACDNTLRCVAKGFADASDGAEIRIERDAGGSGAVVATISSATVFAPSDIRIDGAPAGLTGAAWAYTRSEDGSSVTSSDLAAIHALVQKLRGAKRVTLGGIAEDDAAIPLAGFSAAMLRLDDRQGRIGGVTALLNRGSRPASVVPPAPPLPRIARHPVVARLDPGEEARLIALVRADQKALFAKEECQDTPQQPEAHALDGAQALVLIPCIMGAYQGSSLAFIAQRGSGRAQRLVAPMPYRGNDPDRADADYFTEGSFDPESGTLSMAARGRAHADCGVSASWIWDGRAFRLSEMALQQACGGIEPGDWPTLFRSEQ
ncbi:DUF1176 domain-containing protein [Sphingomonas hengshuiensis]|uniref:DUF1176 domain-containing protein n=1 Tax=Sphingomonas hengshuiensis TaxID=1609977 RepID=A0A7U4LEB4_9SPHN|nr:DUF1176 domain-containing protein [Sphingomonas hengshuiensis]AJP71292.1 hypothetical protein TS85_05020 [Sphingomonas hengshuiensis]